MTDVKEVGNHREFLTMTGNYAGQRLTACSHGVGAGGANVCFMQLLEGGAQVMIRAGTCGSLDVDLNDGDLIVATGAVREDGATEHLMPLPYPAISDHGVVGALLEAVTNQGVNDGIDLAHVDLRGNPVPNGGHSYGVVNGAGGTGKAADEFRPGTVLTVTRNISGPANGQDSLSDQGDNPQRSTATRFALWKGADQHPADARTMASLNSNAGQSGMSDGSAMQSNDASLQQNTRMHHQELGGNFRGSPSGFLDTPND